MYKFVGTLLTLGWLLLAFNFFKFAFGAGINQQGIQIFGWVQALSILPALISGIVALSLYFKRNAARFWVYLTATIFASASVLNLIALLPQAANVVSIQSSTSQLMATANIILLTTLAVKILICLMIWKLIKDGELTYQPT